MSPAALKRALDPAYIGSPFGLQIAFREGTVSASTPLDLTGREVVLFLDRKGLPDDHVEITATDAGEGVAVFEAETDDWIKGEYAIEVRLDGGSVLVGTLPVASGAAVNGSDTLGGAQPAGLGLLVAGGTVVQVVLPPQGLPGPAGADGEDGHTPTDEELDGLIAPQVAAAVATFQDALALKADILDTTVVIAGTTYTVQNDDNGKVLEFTNAAGCVVTVPATLPDRFNCLGAQLGAVQVTFTAGPGATLNGFNGLKTAGRYADVSLRVRANVGGSSADAILGGGVE